MNKIVAFARRFFAFCKPRLIKTLSLTLVAAIIISIAPPESFSVMAVEPTVIEIEDYTGFEVLLDDLTEPPEESSDDLTDLADTQSDDLDEIADLVDEDSDEPVELVEDEEFEPIDVLHDIDFEPMDMAIASSDYSFTPSSISNGKFIGPTGGRFIASIEPIADLTGWIPVSNRAELEAIANNLSGRYYLTADIDLAGAEWVPIGRFSTPFTGTFDGQGYVIRNLTITAIPVDGDAIGLFGCVFNAKIMKLGLEELNINIINTSSYLLNYVGGLCGVARNNVVIENSYVTGTISVSQSNNAILDIGGIISFIDDFVDDVQVSIISCYNASVVSGSSEFVTTGGIVGSGGNLLTISNSYNLGAITSIGNNRTIAGGIVGYGGSINNCYNAGTITASQGSNPVAAGISGSVSLSISNSYNAGSIIAAGFMSDASGITAFGDIITSYNTGSVSSSSPFLALAFGVSSLFYPIQTSHIYNTYWNSESIQTVNDSPQIPTRGTQILPDPTTPLTTSQMRDQSSFVGFDFDNVWGFRSGENDGFPVLRVFHRDYFVESVSLNRSSLSLELGTTDSSLTATVLPSTAANRNYTWSSSNPAVATVSNTGQITVVSLGTTTITVTTDDGGFTATCTVIVTKRSGLAVVEAPTVRAQYGVARRISFYLNDIELNYNNTGVRSFSAVIENDGGFLGNVSISGSRLYFDVDSTATKGDLATISITITTYNYLDITTTLTVEVTDPVAVDGITFNKDFVMLTPDVTERIRATISPYDATYTSLLWESSNEDIVTVDNLGWLTPTGLGGPVTITAKSDCGFEATLNVHVKPNPPQVRINRTDQSIFTDAVSSVPITWQVEGLGNLTTRVEVIRNNATPIIYPGVSGTIFPVSLTKPANLMDTYVIRVTVTNQYGDFASDNISFEVYDSTALAQEFAAPIILDNAPDVTDKTSAQLFEMRDALNLTHTIQLGTDNFSWSVDDRLTWELADGSIAGLFHLTSNGWAVTTPDLELPPTTAIRIDGYVEGTTTLSVTHEKTGMSVDVPVTVNTLENRLFMIRTVPAQTALVMFTNGLGIVRTYSTNSNGELAFYEPSGINSDVTVRTIIGDDTWHGTINRDSLISGENASGLYPINTVRMTLLSNITLFIMQPDGSRYQGDIQLTGGLFRNDVFVPASLITSQRYNNSIDSSGRVSIHLDTASFGTLTATDRYRYAFEIRFIDGNYAPMIFEVDAFYDVNEALRSNSFTLHLSEWDETRPHVLYRYNGENISHNIGIIGISDENPSGTISIRAALPEGKILQTAQIRGHSGILATNQASVISNYPFLTDISYAEITWNIDNTTIPLATTQSFNVEFMFTDGTSRTMRMPFSLSNMVGLHSKANEAAFLTIPVSAQILTTAALSGHRNIPILPIAMPNVNLQTRELDFNIILDATNDPTFYLFYGYMGIPEFRSRTHSNSMRDEFEHIKHEVITKRRYEIKAGISYASTSIKAYVEGFLVWNPATESFDMIMTKGDMVGGISLSFDVSFTFRPFKSTVVLYPLKIKAGVESGISSELGMKIFDTNEVMITNKFTIQDKVFAGAYIDLLLLKGGIDVYGKNKYILENGSRYDAIERKAAQATRFTRDVHVGIDAWGWAGVRIKIPFTKISRTATLARVRETLWKETLFSASVNLSGDSSIWQKGGYSSYSDSISPVSQAASSDALGFAFYDNIPALQGFSAALNTNSLSIPPIYPDDTIDALVVGDNTFAVAAWESINPRADDDFFDAFVNAYSDDIEVDVDELIDIMNLFEISVSVWDGVDWTAPLYLTDNNQPDGSPIIAVDTVNERAVVAWQRDIIHSEGEGDDDFAIVTELWFSTLDNGDWSAPVRLDSIGENMLYGYQLAMNASGFALIADIGVDGSDDKSDVVAYFVSTGGVISRTALTNSNALHANAQIVANSTGFYLAYYRFSESGNDIVLSIMSNAGRVDIRNALSVFEVSGLSLLNPTMDFKLVSGDNNQAALLCRAYDFDVQGDAIYAIKIMERSGDISLSAPMTAVLPDSGYELVILGGSLSGYQVTIDYGEYMMPEDLEDDIVISSYSVTRTFINSFVSGVSFNNLDVRANDSMLVSFAVANIGMDQVTSVEIKIDGISYLTDSNAIRPGALSMFAIALPIGNNVSNPSYNIIVHFANGDTDTFDGVLSLAKPDVSIGRITTIAAERGVREFSVNLFNDSDVSLKGSGNEVHLSFFHDPANEIPAAVSGQKIILSSEDLELLDAGGLNLQFSYAISQSDLVNGEIPNTGMRLFVSAEIRNNGNLVEENNYLANQAAIGINSLLRHDESSVAVAADIVSSNSGSVAELHITNLSMQMLKASDGVIHASLIDDNNEIIETKTFDITENISAEDSTIQTIQFEKAGVLAIAVFEATSPDDDTPSGETTPPGGGGAASGGGTTQSGGGSTAQRDRNPTVSDTDDNEPDESYIYTIREPDEVAHDNIADNGNETGNDVIAESPAQPDISIPPTNELPSSNRMLFIILAIAGAAVLAGTAFIVVRKLRRRTYP
jgi:uncharacterized protein YjdB